MSDVPPQEQEEAEDGAVSSPAPPKRGKKRIIIVGAAALLLIGGGGAGYMMLAGNGAEAEPATHAEEDAPSFVEVPPVSVNLRSPDGQPRFLKVRFVLVPKQAGGEEKLKEKLPLILDAFQPFLRELRPEDLAGSAAVFRLKEEMLVRATSVTGPDAVRDVLIQDLIQQ